MRKTVRFISETHSHQISEYFSGKMQANSRKIEPKGAEANKKLLKICEEKNKTLQFHQRKKAENIERSRGPSAQLNTQKRFVCGSIHTNENP